ncbi:MAG: PilN domain-containing protein [Thermodesulfobacteriota bacterium]|nr:PilN domain-containing protein [Thermodesulfobacteriota bacterium]
MIKINLLLTRKEKKKVGIKKEFVVLILSVIFLSILIIGIHWKIGKEKEEMMSKISQTKKEIAYYKSLTAEVHKAKEAQKTLQDKLNVINSLKKGKGTPVRVLDEISVDKPEKLHLESLKKEGTKLGIEGIALDDETIVNFMTNLKKSKLFKNVDLIVSEQIEQSKIKLKKFVLSCEIISM